MPLAVLTEYPWVNRSVGDRFRQVHLPLGDFASSPSGRIYPLRSNRLPPPKSSRLTAPAVKEFVGYALNVTRVSAPLRVQISSAKY